MIIIMTAITETKGEETIIDTIIETTATITTGAEKETDGTTTMLPEMAILNRAPNHLPSPST
jgi:hypothetical protein